MCVPAGKILLHHTAIHDALDVVGAVSALARLASGPGEVPFANPEIKLFLLRDCTWIRLRRRLLSSKNGREEEKQGNFRHGFTHGSDASAWKTLVHLAHGRGF